MCVFIRVRVVKERTVEEIDEGLKKATESFNKLHCLTPSGTNAASTEPCRARLYPGRKHRPLRCRWDVSDQSEETLESEKENPRCSDHHLRWYGECITRVQPRENSCSH